MGSLRVIAGEFGGRRLLAPRGLATRPTMDRVRESLMSTIASARGGFIDARVLDAFAGSGLLGFEALSRGACFLCAVERDRNVVTVLRENAQTLGLSEECVRLIHGDVSFVANRLEAQSFDLVFLDPPYALAPKRIFELLAVLDGRGNLSKEAIVTYEHDKDASESVDGLIPASRFSLASRKNYGDTVIDFMIG